ncbi:MAG: DUF1667 domain-containing protein [Coriobacteriia bacterium]|nr:DUF1667 domain-containing protein [Coriobacteriia bacterium]
MASSKKEYVTCTCCPAGCLITVTLDGDKVINVEGYTCPRGKKYAAHEVTNPVRTVTAYIYSSLDLEPVSVKTEKPIPKDKIEEVVDIINSSSIDYPVKIGDTIIENVAGTGIDIIATKNIG